MLPREIRSFKILCEILTTKFGFRSFPQKPIVNYVVRREFLEGVKFSRLITSNQTFVKFSGTLKKCFLFANFLQPFTMQCKPILSEKNMI